MSIYVEQALKNTGIDRPNLVMVCTYLVRSGQAKSATDAIRRLEEGDFDAVNLNEEMIQAHQMEKVDVVVQNDVVDTTEEWQELYGDHKSTSIKE